MTSQEALEFARSAHLTIEPLYVLGYQAPDAAAEYEALGIDGSQFYVGVRSAPMGMAAPEAVTSAFYNFSPQLIAAAIPAVWQATTPQTLYAARYARIDTHYRGMLGADVLTSPEMVEAAALAREAATSLRAEGRTLFAGHAALPWPEEPHLQLFHAQMLLREHRGDGHIAALVLADLDGLEALITHVTLDVYGFMERVSRSSRGWTDEEWAAGYKQSRLRGTCAADRRSVLEMVRRMTLNFPPCAKRRHTANPDAAS